MRTQCGTGSCQIRPPSCEEPPASLFPGSKSPRNFLRRDLRPMSCHHTSSAPAKFRTSRRKESTERMRGNLTFCFLGLPAAVNPVGVVALPYLVSNLPEPRRSTIPTAAQGIRHAGLSSFRRPLRTSLVAHVTRHHASSQSLRLFSVYRPSDHPHATRVRHR